MTGFGLFALSAWPASHSDAPLIKQDPQANLTDVYTFVGTKYNDPTQKMLNVVVQVHPFCEPGDGVIYDRFADDAKYSIHITDPSTGVPLTSYDFEFSAVTPPLGNYKNVDTILSYGRGTKIGAIKHVGDDRQNFVQTYSVTKTDASGSRMIGANLPTPPPNVGQKVTPHYNDANGVAVSGATSFAALDKYTRESVFDLTTGEACFAGMREDGFFADAPGIFDLLEARILGPDGQGQTGNGVDGFKGYDVLVFAIQIPIATLANNPSVQAAAKRSSSAAPTASYPWTPTPKRGAKKADPPTPSMTVGVYASVSRGAVTLRSSSGPPVTRKPFQIQVNRMGNPLFNEVLVALRDKDNYNRANPANDPTGFQVYAMGPEIITLLNAVFGTQFVTTGRTDLANIYIPDVLRVDITTPPVRLAGQTGFSRLSVFGGDTTTNANGDNVPSGWPNGRRLGDDVVDIALTVVASGPSFKQINLLGDNINANDQVFNFVFPYAATPWSGPRNSKDSGPNVGH
jgi:hypothetical protein